ncbi:hypothetical protein [Aquitalea denitrificans]|uniref:hypothetical protein n=1 Tax=Aquitalea denitrificans TaxID=519081 RepID=UPI00196A871E|nr:hypothetical protein [Aquitalea denitrificans]
MQDAIQLYTKNDSRHQHLKQLFTLGTATGTIAAVSTLSGHIMPATGKAPQPLRQCLDCRHYHISHDARFPYACTALKIKSKRQPCLDVLEASGQPCLYRQQKTGRQP